MLFLPNHRTLIAGLLFASATFCAIADQGGAATPELDRISQSEEILENPRAFFEGIEDFQDHASEQNLPDDIRAITDNIASGSRAATSNAASRMEHTPGRIDFTFHHDDTPIPEGQANVFGPDPQGQDDQISKLLPEQGETRYVLYLSFSMPDQVLKQALLSISGRKDAVGVIQGLIEKDHSIRETMLAIRSRLKTFDIEPEKAPSVYIEPQLFSHFGVTSVPTLTRFEGDVPIISAKGHPSIEHLDRRYMEGERGPLGVFGNLYDIGEEHFLAMIKRRTSKLDGEKLANQARDNFWKHQAMHPVPMATETTRYLIDPTIEAQEDVQAPDGTYIVRAGERINPLDKVPFNQVGIIFNGNDQDQVDWAIREAEQALSQQRAPIMMTTHIDDREHGWEAYKRINEQFPMGLKMLDQTIINRFDIQHAPSKFEQHGRHIEVTEVALDAPQAQ